MVPLQLELELDPINPSTLRAPAAAAAASATLQAPNKPRRCCGAAAAAEPNKPRRCCSRRCCTLATGAFAGAVVTLLVAGLIGSEIEWANVKAAPSTDWLYASPAVCAAPTADAAPQTRANASTAATLGLNVRHCGTCGACSNANDIRIYNETRNTLTKTATRCALRAFNGGGEAVDECFDEDVGFTPECRDCWTENVLCDQRSCVWTCLRSLLLGESNNNGAGEDTLNKCLECDEKLCGPAFTVCAGANRRRSGITTDIKREAPDAVCPSVSEGWWRR